MLRPRRVKGTVRTIRIQAYSFHITHDQNWQACIFATTFRSLVFGWIYTFSLVFELDQYFERLRVVYLNVLLHKKYIQNTSIIWWASKKSFLWIKTSTFSSHSLSVHFTYFFMFFWVFLIFLHFQMLLILISVYYHETNTEIFCSLKYKWFWN